ncbi:MAG: SurA N-terminal domain-containing protein [Pseudomonadota bacterium]|nr:SurA N-terminal domain-containing protein [Pseudomonadota bacterium]
MMESMRNLAKTFIAKIMLGLLVVAFGLWGVTGVAGSAFESIACIVGFCPSDLAQVGSITIKGNEFTNMMQRQIRNMAQQTGQALTLDDARKLGVNAQVLDAMIAQAAVTQSVKKLGLSVSDKDLQGDLISNKQFQDSTGKFSIQNFRSALANAGLSEQQYFANQRRVHTEQAIVNSASNELALPKTLSDALNQYEGETRDVKYFDITATAADATTPTDADLQAQYKKDPAAYTAPEYRTGVVMVADVNTTASAQKVSDDELQKAWEQHKGEFGTPEKRTIIQLSFKSVDDAAKAKARIIAGEDIIKIAGENGLKETDITQTEKLRQDFIDKAIGDAAFALKEGDVSEPVQGALATALLKAVKVIPAVTPTFEQSKAELTQRVQLEKAKAALQEVYNTVEDARAKNLKLEEIAKTNGLNLVILPPISASGQNQAGADISAMLKPEALKAMYTSDVGVDNDAIQVADGFVWYDVRSVIPSALKPFDQVKDKVTADVSAARVRQAAIDKAKAIVAALKSGKSFDDAAKDASATVKTITTLKRNQQSEDFDGSALGAAFSVLDQGFAFTAGGDGKSARIMQIVKDTMPMVDIKNTDFAKAKDQIHGGFVNDLQSGLVDDLKKSAGVKINNDLWKLVNNGEAPVVE